MVSIARVLALAGVILLGMGSFIPTNKAQGLDSAACATVLKSSMVDPDCFAADLEAGFLTSNLGLVLLTVALLGLYPALTARTGRLWALALTATLTAATLFIYQDALQEQNLAGDLDWGWGVIGGGVVLLVLAAFVATVRASGRAAAPA